MGTGAITSYVDVAQLVLYAFWIFFAGLIYYLVRENRREGYPLETHRGSRHEGWIPMPTTKTYLLDDGRTVDAPKVGKEGGESESHYQGEQAHRGEGMPIDPVGDPLLAGVGAGAWAQRWDIPDMDHHGVPKIRPLALAEGCDVSENDPDPRGMTVVDAEDETVGTVRELWLDVPEMVFRYLDVELADGSRRALVPMTFARVTASGVKVHALLASQYAHVPATKAADRITLLEEERISAYFGAGTLYATPGRSEPLV
jgi:photosynthetic reaction center H subunit